MVVRKVAYVWGDWAFLTWLGHQLWLVAAELEWHCLVGLSEVGGILMLVRWVLAIEI
jgi:hypothetical protein